MGENRSGSRLATLKPRIQAVVRGRLEVAHRNQQQANKPSQQPGYRIRGREGQRLRTEWLERNPLCVKCLEKGIVKAAAEVDHIIPLSKGGQDTQGNRQSLCYACHEFKTITDVGYATRRPVWIREETVEQKRKRGMMDALLQPAHLRPSAIPLTIVCGPAGAGKSTYITKHAAPGDTVIDMDQIRAFLGIGVNAWTNDTLKRSLTKRNAMLAELATASTGNAWFIVAAAPAHERERWAAMLRAQRVVVVLASVDTCISRIKAERTGHRAERSARAARKWFTRYTRRSDDDVISS